MNELEMFRKAESYVMQHYSDEIESVREFLTIDLNDVDKCFFMRQYTHVVYCSGFNWDVVNDKWDKISDTYYHFDIPSIVLHESEIRLEAMKIIKYEKKIESILDTARWLNALSDTDFKQYLFDGKKNLNVFKNLGYIADKTKYHLGLCLGFDNAKPDVHITRLAKQFNKDPLIFCKDLSETTGLPVRVVDAILWRASKMGVIH